MSSDPSLSAFVPDLLLERLAQGRSMGSDANQELLAATFFADLAGFTAMADALAEGGPQGPEQLTEVLDHVFGRLIERVIEDGGDVIRFAGDAILVIWRAQDAEDLPRVTRQAARCALRVHELPLRHPYLPGDALRLRIGVGAGPLRMVRIGGLLDRWEFVVTGQAMHDMGRAAEQALPGQVLVSGEAWTQLAGFAAGQGEPGGAFSLRALSDEPEPRAPAADGRRLFPTVGDTQVWPFIPGAVRHRFDAGMRSWLAELRPLSVLFVNLPPQPDQAAPGRAQLQQLLHIAQRELYRYEGAVDKVLMDDKGCTVLAAFGLPPLSHEDDAERAVRAALGIAAHLGSRAVSHRIGVASGRVYAGAYGHPQRREYSILGDTVNLAARLMQRADNGVLCCEVTRRAVGGRMEFEALDPVRVKGKRESVVPHRPVRSRPDGTAALAMAMQKGELPDRPVVGRRSERRALEGALHELRERGQGGLVLLRGDAGIGKSVLVSWLLQRGQALGIPARFGSGDAIERSTAYRAWRPVVTGLMGLDERSGLEDLRAVAERAIAGHANAASWGPLLQAFLPVELPENEVTRSMTGSVRAENTRELVVHLLGTVVAQSPLLVVLEDAHWMDAASWALAAAVLRRVPAALVVIAMRPVLDEPPPELDEMLADKERCRVLDLGGLGRQEIHDLAAASLGVDELPLRVERLLLERAEGNPFYTEELVAMLRDLQVVHTEGRRCRLADEGLELEQLRLPDSVQGAVTSRLDRLDPHHQFTLKVASVVGRRFPYQVTHDVHPVKEDRPFVGRHLSDSVERGLVALDEPGDGRVYRFQHSITQQVAYNLLAYAQRRQIHSAVARWYESAPEDDPATLLPRLAYHWRKAGDDAKTLYYCTRAGEHALARGAMKDAIYFLRVAVRLAERSQQRKGRSADWLHRVRTRRKLGEAYASVSETRLALEQLQTALSELGHPLPRSRPGRIVRAVWELARLALGMAWPRRLRFPTSPERRERIEELTRILSRVADELFALTDIEGMVVASLAAINNAERIQIYEPAVHAYNAIGYVLGVLGSRRLGGRFLERARSGDALAVCNSHYARGLWLLGDACFDESEQELRTGLEHARRVGDIPAIATGVSCLGTRLELTGDFEGALR